MLKQITASAAIEAERGGKAVIVILTTPEHDRIKWVPLKSLLDGCIFLMDDAEPEAIKETQEEGSTPAAEKPKKARKVDVGKIMALHDAGWSNVKIADEMRLHPVTVGKYIKARKENENG